MWLFQAQDNESPKEGLVRCLSDWAYSESRAAPPSSEGHNTPVEPSEFFINFGASGQEKRPPLFKGLKESRVIR